MRASPIFKITYSTSSWTRYIFYTSITHESKIRLTTTTSTITSITWSTISSTTYKSFSFTSSMRMYKTSNTTITLSTYRITFTTWIITFYYTDWMVLEYIPRPTTPTSTVYITASTSNWTWSPPWSVTSFRTIWDKTFFTK